MADELVAVADVVGLVVFGVGEDHEDAIGGEVMHLAPQPGPDEETLGRRIEHDALLALTIEETQSYGPGYAHAKLPEFLVRVEAAANTRPGAVDPVDAPSRKWQGPAELGDAKLPTGITVQGDINKLDE